MGSVSPSCQLSRRQAERSGRTVFVALMLGLLPNAVPSGQAIAQVARLNLTGAWDGNFFGGSSFKLSQEGDRVWGTFEYGNGTGFARGSWSGGRLILILTPTTARVGDSCDPRKLVIVQAKGTATRLEPDVLDLASGTWLNGIMTRTSPSPGAVGDYPFAAELKNCGQLLTYDLVFATNSAELKGANGSILEVLAGLLKSDPALKVQITGHTDSTGDATANQALSQRRAEAVKQALVEKYGVDGGRLTAKGYGAEQPVADNATEAGRAVNRRVEIVKQ